MKARVARRVLAATVLAVGLAGTSGCLSLESVPMPSQVRGPTYTLQAVFGNVLNVPQGAPVKLDGNVVGLVEEIQALDYRAHLTLELRTETRLPLGTLAEVRTTGPMGTSFIELTPPARATRKTYPAGATLPITQTSTAPDVSDLFTAVSATVTGGPFADISTIIKQLNIALEGREGDVRQLLERLRTLTSGLNQHTAGINRTLDALDRMTRQLADGAPTLSQAVDDLTPAIRTLAAQRDDVMTLLDSLTRLSSVSRRVIAASKADLVAQVREVGPVLTTLVDNIDQMRPLMRGLVDFGRSLDSATPGDYARFALTAIIDPVSAAPIGAEAGSLPSRPAPRPARPLPDLPWPGQLPLLQGLQSNDETSDGGLLGLLGGNR